MSAQLVYRPGRTLKPGDIIPGGTRGTTHKITGFVEYDGTLWRDIGGARIAYVEARDEPYITIPNDFHVGVFA